MVSGPEISVQILTTSNWPNYLSSSIKLPPEVVDCQTAFQKFYGEQARYRGRELSWVDPLSTCILEAQFPNALKELDLSGFQACVLLCFNRAQILSFGEIQRELQMGMLCLRMCSDYMFIDSETLTQTLVSLLNIRLLRTKAKGALTSSDVFKVNESFAPKLFRVKINPPQLQETVSICPWLY